MSTQRPKTQKDDGTDESSCDDAKKRSNKKPRPMRKIRALNEMPKGLREVDSDCEKPDGDDQKD